MPSDGERPAGRDRGSGSIYVLIAASVLMALSVAGATVGDAVLARHRAESAADLVAIAGATAGLRGGDACLAAAVDADRRGVELERCRSADDGSIVVVVRLAPSSVLRRLPVGPALARARAGPVVDVGMNR
jgi:secretion/DNA translocation related TadE-like protein